MNKLLLIDGMSLLFRGYFATAYHGRIRRTASGLPTNGVHFLIRYMNQAILELKPSHIICCWDTAAPTFRHDYYDQYKSNRPSPPADLVPQFQLAQEVVKSLGILNVSLEGYEADDLMGALAKKHGPSIAVDILTGDHDSLQLVDDQINVIIMEKGFGNLKRYTKRVLLEEKGLSPEQIIDLKALMGDRSDNYPGVPGIGEKTALKLLNDFGTIDELLKQQEKLLPSVKTKIEKGMALLSVSRKLAEIRCDVPLEIELGRAEWVLNIEEAEEMFLTVELMSLLDECHKVKQSTIVEKINATEKELG